MEALRLFSVLAVLAIAAPMLPVMAQGPDHVVITAVYYDTYVTNEGDEFVRLHNPTGSAVDLSGWKLTDGEGNLTFPSGATLGAGQSWFVAGKATDFVLDMVVGAQWEYLADTDPAVPQLSRTGTFSLANTGDEVRLLQADATVVDAAMWGTSPGSPGWSGAAIPDQSEGVVLERDRDELTGAWLDTDTAADWDDARLYVVGQTHFGLATYEASGATLYSSPDSSYEAIVAFLDGATSTLDLELYELTNPYLGDAILARAQDNVTVRLLIEGGPAGILQEERHTQNWILDRLEQAGAEVRFLITNASQGIHDRYDFQHGKFAIADGARVLAMSGNWKYSGVPVDPSYGNREWGIVVDSPGVAGYVQQVFDDDFSAAHRDILPFGEGTDWRYLPPPPGFSPNLTVPTGTYAPYFPSESVAGPFSVTPILSPDTSTLEFGSLREALRNAQSEVLIEQMYAHKHWGPTQTGTPETHPNLYLEAAIEAARNGAKVYVLLGEEYIDENDTRNNAETAAYLNGIGQAENITLRAKLLNHTIAELLKVHNKGVVIDGHLALVSSINWGRNSAHENRELALLVDSAPVAQFYRDLFWYDWSPREFKPLTDLIVTRLNVTPAQVAVPPALPWLLPFPAPPTPPPPPLLAVDHPQAHVVEVTIKNIGRYGAGDFDVTVQAEPTFLGEARNFTARVNSLPRGQSLTLQFLWDDMVRLGDFELRAMVDSGFEVNETNEENNTLAAPATVLLSAPGAWVPLPRPDAPPVAVPSLPE